MELNPLTVSVLLVLTELALTGVLGFQVYLFKQVSAARREHLELRLYMAQNYVSNEQFDKVISRLETRLENHLDTYFRNLNKRANA
ncbi:MULTISPECIES: hypothetical protein [unclassified Pseudomonas]|jgi:predicted negative regulator of RcsB-dependent stress response|uniref:hypothetical protein n=1 Tax=unclassified Pseudomonas TaxID=196821 RepID=UPI000C17C954|nr:hypothetical protein [Pseudomonas sp. HLS-6]ATR85178.1 hypothetical protein CS390_22980 [Pseudomonas sp. HLS-6]